MKKILSLALAVLMLLGTLTGCTKTPDQPEQPENKKLKLGFVLVGDENEGYTFAHMDGIEKAAAAVGNIEIVYKKSVGETQACYDAAVDLLENGCQAVFTNSYGHQSYAQQVASEYPNNTIVAATGDTAAISGLNNFSNAFTKVYESRYVSGVVAGMKIAELIKDGKLTEKNYDENGNVKVGYVGAYTYAEVVSGFTAFYLGIKSVVENVTMYVTYTGSWFSITDEAEAANMLMKSYDCVIIGQHADSTGAPSAVQAELENGRVCYSVGYNVDMLSVAPQAALTSATNNWSKFYEYAFRQIANGQRVAVDWAEGYTQDAVGITELGSSCAEGTAAKVEETIAAIKAGTLHVFDTSTWTVNGEHLTELVIDLDGDFKTDSAADKNAIYDGYFHESEFRSAPSFSVIIDGIVNLNEKY